MWIVSGRAGRSSSAVTLLALPRGEPVAHLLGEVQRNEQPRARALEALLGHSASRYARKWREFRARMNESRTPDEKRSQ